MTNRRLSAPTICCMLTNIRSLVKNAESFVSFVCKENCDLALITESWLSTKNHIAPLLGNLATHYNCFRCDRSNKRGGGIAIIVKNLHSTSTVFCESVLGAYEILACDISFFSKDIRFITVYRTPDCPSYKNDVLIKALSDLASCQSKCIIAGDFNLSHVGNGLLYPCRDGICNSFRYFFTTHGFKHYISFPTRHTSYLDLLLCNDSSIMGSVTCYPPIGSSDHATIRFSLSITRQPTLTYHIMDFARGDYDAFRLYLAQVDWLGSFSCLNNIDEIYEMFLAILHHAMELFIPIVHRTSTKFKLPSYLRKMSTHLDQLWGLATKSNSTTDWANFKALSAVYNKKLTLCRKTVNSEERFKSALQDS